MSNESQAITACQAGRSSAFAALYEVYLRKIYDFIYYKTWHRETAEDLTAETFRKALEKIGKFDPAKGTFQSWIYQIARNSVIDHYRTRKFNLDIEDAWDLTDETDIPRDTDTALQLAVVRKELVKLTPEQREILILRLWQGHSHAEIATILGKNEKAVKVSYSRALGALRAELVALLIIISHLHH